MQEPKQARQALSDLFKKLKEAEKKESAMLVAELLSMINADAKLSVSQQVMLETMVVRQEFSYQPRGVPGEFNGMTQWLMTASTWINSCKG